MPSKNSGLILPARNEACILLTCADLSAAEIFASRSRWSRKGRRPIIPEARRAAVGNSGKARAQDLCDLGHAFCPFNHHRCSTLTVLEHGSTEYSLVAFSGSR